MTIINPAVSDIGWRGADLTDPASWTVEVDDRTADQLVDVVRERSSDPDSVAVDATTATGTTGHPAGERPADGRVLPAALREALSAAKHDLLHGRGFVLLRGLPVDELDDVGNELLCTLVGRELGVPIRQNDRDEMIVRVRDEGKDFSVKGVRSYETAAPLAYHSDSSDVVGLSCIRSARSGGASTIVSSVAVHQAMFAARPDLARLLHEPWATASIIEQTVHWKPICAVNDAGELFTRYGRLYLETASDYDATIAPLTDERVEALDVYDSFLEDPSFALDMAFRPGDLQLLNNYRIMHARHPYVDWPEPERRRELLRIWLVVGDLDVPDVFEDSGFVPRSEALR